MKKEFIIRAGISISLLSIFLYFIGINKVIEEISKTSIPFFMLALAIENAGVFLSAKRWQILLSHAGVELKYMDALSFYYMGSFFNVMMPSSFGGDVIKAYKLGKKTKNVESFSSVIMDRIAGLIAVMMIAMISILFFYSLLPYQSVIISLLIIFSFIALISLMLATTTFEKITMILFARWERIQHFLMEVIDSVKNYKGKKLWVCVISLSLLYHLMLVLNNYILALSIGIETRFIYFLIFIPVSQILVSLPVSIQGFGVREGSYAMLFSSVGMEFSAAFSLGFLNQMVKVITSMIGGVVYVVKK